jgi:hypothetical protein
MTLVKFEGDPPFALPVLQRATADAAGEAVELTVYVAIAAHGPEPVPVRASMTHGVALVLAERLKSAAVQAELAAAQTRED